MLVVTRMKIAAFPGTRKWRMRSWLAICCSLVSSLVFSAYASAAAPAERPAACPSASIAPLRHCAAAFPDSQFTIGDFDGDRQPDVATVEMVRFNPLHSRYSVSFQLSTGGVQTIGFTGPAGGLLLIARDVNGDRALDLVLVTAWQHNLVAVFLNDGFGNFAAADPRNLRIEVVSSHTRLATPPVRFEDRAVLAVPYFRPGDFDRGILARPQLESELASAQHLDFASSLSQPSFLGRAPPARLLPA
jgi:hypothetical protein